MGATRTKPWGYRHGTRNKFSKVLVVLSLEAAKRDAHFFLTRGVLKADIRVAAS